MQKGFCGYKFRAMIITASFSALVEYLLQFTDKLIIGRILGDLAFSATDMITPLFSIALFISTMIGKEIAHSHAFYMGRFEPERANQFWGMGVILAIAGGFFMLGIAILGKYTYFNYLGLSEELYFYAENYYRYYQFTALLYPFYMLLAKVIYEDGSEWLYMISVLVRIVGNAVISYLLCKSIGISGAGIGTLISTVLSMLILLLHFFRKGNSLHFRWHFSFRDIGEVLRSGAPFGIVYLYQAIFTFLLSKFIVVRFGEKNLSVLSVATVILAVSAIFDSVNQAAEPLCYIYIGEGNRHQLRYVMQMTIKISVIFGAAASVFFLLFSKAAIFSLGFHDLSLMDLAVKAAYIIAPSLIFASLFCVQSSYYGMIGKNGICIALSGLKELFLPLLIALPLSMLIGLNGIWIGFSLSPLITLFLCIFVFQRQKSIRNVSLLPEEGSDVFLHTFNLILSEEEIVKTRDRAAELLRKQKIGEKTVYSVMLMIEEIFMLVTEKNKDKKIYAECTIRIDEDDVQLILRDSGMIFDVTDCEMDLTSMRVYMVSRMMERQEEKIHHVTTSYNRNAFRFVKQESTENV